MNSINEHRKDYTPKAKQAEYEQQGYNPNKVQEGTDRPIGWLQSIIKDLSDSLAKNDK